MGAQTVAKNAMLEAIRANTLFLGLFLSDPAGGGAELAGASYARQAVNFAAAEGGMMENSEIAEFSQALEEWGTITHWGLFNGPGAGAALLWTGSFDSAREIRMGDLLFIQAGGITLEIRECQS